jgi:hypothetical protein
MFRPQFWSSSVLYEHSQVIKHVGYNTDPYLLTDYCVANMSREHITKLQLWLKGYKEYSQSYKYDRYDTCLPTFGENHGLCLQGRRKNGMNKQEKQKADFWTTRCHTQKLDLFIVTTSRFSNVTKSKYFTYWTGYELYQQRHFASDLGSSIWNFIFQIYTYLEQIRSRSAQVAVELYLCQDGSLVCVLSFVLWFQSRCERFSACKKQCSNLN